MPLRGPLAIRPRVKVAPPSAVSVTMMSPTSKLSDADPVLVGRVLAL
eukprot:CAMPEP_0194751360 /NCGR_PEP_ID=MMETSP0323_2-20130528/5448_1 /TAXON_ID=2866 ORGANISM="Crypthecodinium cohnii, Strain Seligo" /NCGR_SAMPLE_ID=MMETSP0323_2 /ASSEMBLY_ACC=CAM_ASM_000346 /LENGTH=46 /DNA_ID= /DNA_START= /DNA_END= /DNA_ORIENTATION=